MEEEADDRTKVLVQTIREKDQTIQGKELGNARLKEKEEETAAALVTARRALEKRNEKLEKIEFLLGRSSKLLLSATFCPFTIFRYRLQGKG